MKLNWYVRVALYSLFATLIGPYYDGWTPTTGFLLRTGVYENRCTKDEIAAVTERHLPKCEAQTAAISGLLSVFRISEFATSVIWGVILDNWGPKWTVLLGMLQRIASWLILIYAPNSGALLAAILAGISMQSISLAVYTISAYSRSKMELGLSCMSVALSLGTFYPLVLNAVTDALVQVPVTRIVLVKLAITHLPLLLIGLLIYPLNLKTDEDVCSNEDSALASRPAGATALPTVGSGSGSASAGDLPSEVDEVWNVRGFLREIAKTPIIVVVLIFTLNSVSLTFAQETFPLIYVGNDFALQTNGILIPCSVVFAMMLAFAIAKCGCANMITFLNLVGILMHCAMFSRSTSASIVASVAMSMCYSGFITIYVIYIDMVVDFTFSSSVKGYLSSVGGVAFFFNVALFSVVSSYAAMVPCHVTMIVIRVALFVPCFYLVRTGTGTGTGTGDVAAKRS